jgi:hypothetical protein
VLDRLLLVFVVCWKIRSPVPGHRRPGVVEDDREVRLRIRAVNVAFQHGAVFAGDRNRLVYELGDLDALYERDQ